MQKPLKKKFKPKEISEETSDTNLGEFEKLIPEILKNKFFEKILKKIFEVIYARLNKKSLCNFWKNP